VVNHHSAGWLDRGFPWVYPKEVQRRPPGIRPGDTVLLQDQKGRGLGAGVWDDGWLAVRRFRPDPGPLDAAWLGEMIEAARARRRGLLPAETDAWRLVHAENDDLPGVRVDRWADELHITLDSPALLSLVPALQSALIELEQPSRLTLGFRRDPRDSQRTDHPSQLLYFRQGAAETHPEEHRITVRERGMRFEVLPAGGSDTGLFCDMRSNRMLLDGFWRDRSVLNLFAYTGAFSLFAAAGAARRVVSADLASTALERIERNLELNGLLDDRCEQVREDSFKLLDRYRRKGERFDLVLADPPPFSHSSEGTFSAGKDLTRLAAACLRVISPGGLFVLACNQGSVSPRNFQGAVEQAARRSDRRLHLVADGTQPPDFPAAVHFPEGRYLKLGVWSVWGAA
jgi:23S rRNA (cytosine1962-C5)-methyltransferase